MHAGAFLATGEEPARGAMPLNGAYACYRTYRCADGGYLAVGALEPQFWKALVTALAVPDLEHEQFAPPERQAQIVAELGAVFGTRTRDEWVAGLAGLEMCVGPVSTFGEAFADPHVTARGMVAEVDGRAVGPAGPLVFDGSRPGAMRPAPGLGEHTEAVLSEGGLSADEVADLVARGVAAVV
jgi:alpha-methylacyl-CoA racemase